MHLSRHSVHLLILATATAVAVVMLAVPKKAAAQTTSGYTPGYYTTTTTSTSSTDPVTGITTTSTTTQTPRGLFSARSNRDHSRTTDIQARYPYDSTRGRNRSDVDAVRSGFDDPRNPWDGRYMNDNPANSPVGISSNATVNSMRGNEEYRPGRYGTRSVRR